MRTRVVSALMFLTATAQLYSQQPAANVDFNKQVQPIFTEQCVGCHKGSGAPSGLQLDSAAGALKGSSSGAVIVPGNSKQSLLAQRISDTAGNQMPPGGPLAKDQIDTIINWIDQGAKADVNPGELTQASPAPARVRPPLPTITTVATAAQE